MPRQVELATRKPAQLLDGLERLVERHREMRLIDCDQGIISDQGGVDGKWISPPLREPIAAKEQPRADLVHGRRTDQGLREVLGPDGIDLKAAAQARRQQRLRAAELKQRRCHAARGRGLPVLERLGDDPGPLEHAVDDDAAIDYEEEPARLSLPETCDARAEGPEPNVDDARLAGTGRQGNEARPPAFEHRLGETSLPGKRLCRLSALIAPKSGEELLEGGKALHGRSKGRHSPSPRQRPAPRMTGPLTCSPKSRIAWISGRCGRLPTRRTSPMWPPPTTADTGLKLTRTGRGRPTRSTLVAMTCSASSPRRSSR